MNLAGADQVLDLVENQLKVGFYFYKVEVSGVKDCIDVAADILFGLSRGVGRSSTVGVVRRDRAIGRGELIGIKGSQLVFPVCDCIGISFSPHRPAKENAQLICPLDPLSMCYGVAAKYLRAIS